MTPNTVPALKIALAKLNSVQAELANAKGKFSVAPPPGLPDKVEADFKKAIASGMRVFGFCDKYMARAQSSAKEVAAVFKTRGL